VLQQAQAAHDAVDDVHEAARGGQRDVGRDQLHRAHLQRLVQGLHRRLDVVCLLSDGRDAPICVKLLAAAAGERRERGRVRREGMRAGRRAATQAGAAVAGPPEAAHGDVHAEQLAQELNLGGQVARHGTDGLVGGDEDGQRRLARLDE